MDRDETIYIRALKFFFTLLLNYGPHTHTPSTVCVSVCCARVFLRSNTCMNLSFFWSNGPMNWNERQEKHPPHRQRKKRVRLKKSNQKIMPIHFYIPILSINTIEPKIKKCGDICIGLPIPWSIASHTIWLVYIYKYRFGIFPFHQVDDKQEKEREYMHVCV